jgi:molybdate transport system ATP-binding protein
MNMILEFQCRHRYASGFSLDVQFEADGHVTALCGPSGSGKTTLLSLIAGLLKPDCGVIRLGDQVVTDTSAGVFLPPEHRRVGLLFQDHCLFPHLRVKANICYGARRRAGKTIPLDRVVETLELQKILERYPRSISGGEQQRVALARAIVCAPKILLLDEPLTAVEAALRERIASFITRVVREFQIPTLLVSHNRVLVDRLASRVILIEHGRIGGSDDDPTNAR